MDTARFLSVNDRWLPGTREVVAVPQPPAGQNWFVVVPGGQQWRVLLGQWTFTAAAAVANRQVGINFGDPAGVTWRFLDTTLIAANGVGVVPVAAGYGPYGELAGGADHGITYPLTWLQQGDSFGASTVNIQAADQYSGILLVIEKLYLTNEQWSELTEERYELAMVAMASRGGQ